MFGFLPYNRKPRQFTYNPRYYDAEKEARDARRRELFGDDEPTNETEPKKYKPGQYVRGMRMSRFHNDKEKEKRYNHRIVIIFIILLFLGFLLFKWAIS